MPQHQRGFSLFEFIVAIVLTSLVGVWSATTWVQQSEDASSEAMGRWLMTVKESVDQMLIRRADSLAGLSSSDQDSVVYQDPWHPRLDELVRAGHLATGFSLRPPLGYDVRIRVLKPAGLCLTLGCKLEVLTIAIPEASESDQASHVTRLGKILASLGGQGASVTHLLPRQVRGPMVQLPNPPVADMAALPIGSILLRSFHDTSAQVSFLRQNEKRDVQLGGSLDVAGQFSAQGNIAAKGSFSSVGGVSTQGDITASGKISTTGYLQLGALAKQGEGCHTGGLLAQSKAGGLLVCQGGVWQSSSKSGGGYYIYREGFPCDERDEIKLNRRNPVTGACNCPAGYTPVLISIWRLYTAPDNNLYTYLCVG